MESSQEIYRASGYSRWPGSVAHLEATQPVALITCQPDVYFVQMCYKMKLTTHLDVSLHCQYAFM